MWYTLKATLHHHDDEDTVDSGAHKTTEIVHSSTILWQFIAVFVQAIIYWIQIIHPSTTFIWIENELANNNKQLKERILNQITLLRLYR